MNALLSQAAERAARYLDTLDARGVAPSPDDIARLAALGGPLPDGPTAPEAVIAELDDIGSPATVGTAGRRFFGFVIGGSLPVTVAANWLATAWDQNVGLWAASPTGSALEEITLGWLVDALKLPPGTGGGFVSGATVANFTALAAARHTVLARQGWDVGADGLFGAPEITVVVGDEAHPSLLKSLSLLGLGKKRVVRVPTDDQGRMRADALPALSGPAIVCVQAGNVNTGAFDPAEAIIPWAHEADAWVHVDGAFGLWAAAAPERAPLIAGFNQADSWGTDAHKWLNVPYDSGLAFVRDPQALRAAMNVHAEYLPKGELREPFEYTPEMSRRARGVEIWAALKTLGREGLADLVERTFRHAQHFAEGLSAAGYPILNDVVLNQVLVSFGDQDAVQRVVRGLLSDGTCWCGGTVWQGHPAMRISVSSWATTDDDVERSLNAILRVAAREGATTARPV